MIEQKHTLIIDVKIHVIALYLQTNTGAVFMQSLLLSFANFSHLRFFTFFAQ